MMKESLWWIVVAMSLCIGGGRIYAQEYAGVSGMIHVPTAEMAEEGTARIGGFFLDKGLIPDRIQWAGKKFDTYNYYLGVTPFSWIEVSFVGTLLKNVKKGEEETGRVRYNQKDRHFNVKLRLCEEGKWCPAVVAGIQDFGSPDGHHAYFQNYYAAVTKHLLWQEHEFAGHLVYRYYRFHYNDKWKGVAAGFTYRPAFARNWRAIVEYTGHEINIGMDCLLWKHLFLQASLRKGSDFSGGICYQVNLLSKNKRKK